MRATLRTGLFLSLLVPLHFAFSAAYERLVLERLALRTVERQFEARLASGEPIRTLALGDSHPRGAVDTTVITDAFNFTASAENSIVTHFKLRWLLAEAPDVDVVVLPADLHSFASYRADHFERVSLLDRYVDWQEVGRTAHAPLRFLGLAAAAKLPYFSGADDAVKEMWTDSVSRATERRPVRDGFSGAPQSFAETKYKFRLRLAESRAHDHFAGGAALDPTSVEYFRRSLELCARRHVRVALVRFPVTKEYWEEAQKYVRPDSFYAEIESIASGFDGVRTLDHHADFFGKDELMRDADHVNARGAALFSAALGAELTALRSGSR